MINAGRERQGAGVLVTGFEPFRQYTVNSSWEGVRLLESVPHACLPVDHGAAAARIGALIDHHRPRVVLLTGLAAGAVPRIETVARRPAGMDGPALRRGRWPFARAVAAIRPARLSSDAGRYVCETAYWTALGCKGPRRVAFLHVPPLSEVWTPRRIARVIAACLRTGLG